MDVADAEMVRLLEARDGPLGSAWRPHREGEGLICRYSELYPDGDCPWCEAEVRRLKAGLAPTPQRSG